MARIKDAQPGKIKCDRQRHINTKIGREGKSKQYLICEKGNCEHHIMLCEEHTFYNNSSKLMKMSEGTKFREHSSYQGLILQTEHIEKLGHIPTSYNTEQTNH